MKSIIFFFALTLVIITSGCNEIREERATVLIDNPKMRQEILSSILSNRKYTSQLIDSLAKNEMGRKLILENDILMREMCLSSEFDDMLNTDFTFMNRMTDSLIRKIELDSVVCDRTCTRLLETKRIRDVLSRHLSKKQ